NTIMNAIDPAMRLYTIIGSAVFRRISPSRPRRPTVAAAATTLWTATMLPEAPPTAWAATIVSGDSTPGRFTPVAYWNWENMRLETVFDPATNAPSAPTNGATSGHALPTEFAAASASTSGMESIPDEL